MINVIQNGVMDTLTRSKMWLHRRSSDNQVCTQSIDEGSSSSLCTIGSLLNIHSQSLSTLLWCVSDPFPAVHQHRGALWGPERGHPGCLHLLWWGVTRQSVSSQCHSVTALAGHSSSSKPQTLSKGPHAWGQPGLGSGAKCGFQSESFSVLTLFFPNQGAEASQKEGG